MFQLSDVHAKGCLSCANHIVSTLSPSYKFMAPSTVYQVSLLPKVAYWAESNAHICLVDAQAGLHSILKDSCLDLHIRRFNIKIRISDVF